MEDSGEESAFGSIVRLACVDDDAQGEILEVVWELELDAEIIGEDAWKSIGNKGFDNPRHFSAFIHTLRWNCVTATNPRLFQAPFRAGIKIDAYQLEPLAKALALPRVNLFIADDVGLGKTIEAGLIAIELLLRRRVRELIVSAPPGMLEQWKDELENRFGLTFEIMDRKYIERVRQQYGFGVNPWETFPRFLISHRLLIDEFYVAPLRDWLGNLRAKTLFILDEAHHAAPSSGARYAIDSGITKAIRDIAPRFEHRLFLSATPHNGHSNSFSALLELLDSHRFVRGVPPTKSNLDKTMVRRLKEDLRSLVGGFPERKIVQIDIDGLPEDAPELALSALLDRYRDVRQKRLSGATKRKQAEGAIVISGLQQRLLSSIDAFARTLKVHRRTMERVWNGEQIEPMRRSFPNENDELLEILTKEEANLELSEEELLGLDDALVESSTASTAGDNGLADAALEKSLLDEMDRIANQHRSVPDRRIAALVDWMRDRMCPGVRMPGEHSPGPSAEWSDIRIIIFTEYEDTRRYLVEMLRMAIAGTHLEERRIEVYHGPTPPEKREAIKRAFNLPPHEHPVRILVATDAAREGLNLQAHCWNLFHFDLPWNPSRLEQRNGRIDRKLQPRDVVYCHYFFFTQRPEDRVLQVLVRKIETIRADLGSLSKVLEKRLSGQLEKGITRRNLDEIVTELDNAAPDTESQRVVDEELETNRERNSALQKQLDALRNRINDAKKWIGFEPESLRDALSCSLELLGAEPLRRLADGGEEPRFTFPNLQERHGADLGWSGTLDTLRRPPDDGKRSFAWRKQSPVRPVTFYAPGTVDEDSVHLHLQHRVVQRLLGRFTSLGFVQSDLSRACLAQTNDAVPRVVLLGRLSLYAKGAIRLHEEILTVSARWSDPNGRKSSLKPYGKDAELKTMDLLEEAIRQAGTRNIPAQVGNRLLASVQRDIEEMLPHLEQRGLDAKADAAKKLEERGKVEADSMLEMLLEQRAKVSTTLKTTQIEIEFTDEEKRQFLSNQKFWGTWLQRVERDIAEEPERIRGFYSVSSYRIEPIGIAYLWPVTG